MKKKLIALVCALALAVGGGDHRRLSAAALAGTFRPLPA